MSLFSGPRSGVRSALRAGLNPSDSAFSMASVAQDASSSKYAPASSAQWTQAMGVAGISSGNPKYGWGCQEASGSLASFLTAGDLTQFGGAVFETVVAGWARKAVQIGGGGAFYNTSIGNTATTSYMWLAYIRVPSTPGAADLAVNVGGGADIRSAGVNTTPAYRAQGNGVVAVEGASNIATAVRPVVLLFNRATTEFSVMTDQEKITTAWVDPTSGAAAYISLGDGVLVEVLYAVLFEGTAAQLSRTQVKTLLQTLGWSPGWTP